MINCCLTSLIITMKFVISKHHARGDFSKALLLQRSRTLQSVKMKLFNWGARRKFRGVQLASAGYYLSRRRIYFLEPLRPLYQATHLLILQRTAPCTNYAACKHLHNLATRLKSQLTCCLLITQFHTYFASEKRIPGK